MRILLPSEFYFNPVCQDVRLGVDWEKVDREGGEFWGGRDSLIECEAKWDSDLGRSYWWAPKNQQEAF